MVLRKILNAIRAFFNKLANKAVEADPVSQYRLQIDEATERIQKGQSALAGFKGHVNRLERNLADAEKEMKLYDSRVNLALKNNDDAAAAKAGVEYQRAFGSYNAIKAQLDSFTTQYQQQVAMIKASRETIIKAQKRCEELGLKLEMSKANKAAAEMASQFADTVKNPLGDLANIESEINRQIDQNNAVAQVNADLGLHENSEAKEEANYEELAARDFLEERKRALGLLKDNKEVVVTAVQQAALPEPVRAVVVEPPEGGIRTEERQALTLQQGR